jgi:hypothetical protein
MKQVTAWCFRQPSADEQEILVQLKVEMVAPDQVERFDELLAKHHYLKGAHLVGEHLRYVGYLSWAVAGAGRLERASASPQGAGSVYRLEPGATTQASGAFGQ